MLLKAMNEFQVAKRAYSEAKKEQYTDMQDSDGAKNFFRASELGSGDRKIIYGFFKHQIPVIARSAKSCRQLENGDYVHERYQTAWEDMGALISMEERLTSKDDEYLKEFDWEWAGHYDGLLDVNILRAHALGLCKLSYAKNEETGKWEMEVEVDDDYAKSIGLFDVDEKGESTYVPLTEVADIKTMNPWGFKRIHDKQDISEIQGYIDQISFYMYMLNTPYGSIFIEDKGSNDLVEIQIVWEDMHEDVTYAFDPEIHGELESGIIRVTINNERFFGSDKVLGLVQRIEHLWAIKKLLEEADADGKTNIIENIMPPRCSEEPGKFPCSWSDGKEKCEFFDHCWNQHTNGCAIRGYEACPADCIWEVPNLNTIENVDAVIKVDKRKLPDGVDYNALVALYNMGAIDLTKFLVDDEPVPVKEAEETAENTETILNANGELNLNAPAAATATDNADAQEGTQEGAKIIPLNLKSIEAIEYRNDADKKAIKCLNCGKEITYDRLGNGGTKKCPFCNNVNRVIKA